MMAHQQLNQSKDTKKIQFIVSEIYDLIKLE